MSQSQPQSPQQSKAADPGFAQIRGPAATTCAAMLILLCAALFLIGTYSTPLMDREETRCALIVQHMLRTGQYMVPYLGGEPYFEKPAPFFWLAAAGQYVTGSVELGGRLVAALTALGAVLVTFQIARRHAGNMAGLLAGAVLATSMYFFFYARWYRMDMPFAAFMWGALGCFWSTRGQTRLFTVRQAAGWLGFYACCAAATLMKGPAGLVLPVAVAGLYHLSGLRWREIGRMALWSIPGLIVFLAVAAPWYVMIAQSQPTYFREFFLTQNLERFAGNAIEKHTFPAITYVALLLGGLMPWTVYLPGAFARTLCLRRQSRRQGVRGLDRFVADDLHLMLWLATLVPLAFFMVAQTRLAGYVLPCFPPLAMLVALPLANWLRPEARDELYDRGFKALAVVLVVLVLGLALTEFIVPKVMAIGGGERLKWTQWLTDFHLSWLDGWVLLPAAALAACLAGMSHMLRRGHRQGAMVLALAALIGAFAFAALHVGPRVYGIGNCRELDRAVRDRMPADARLICFLQEQLSFPLYCGKDDAPLIRLSRQDEIKTFQTLLDSGKPIYALVPTRLVPSKNPRPGEKAADYPGQLVKQSGRTWTRLVGDDYFSIWRSN